MWWLVKKISDDTKKVSYSYGFETKEQSGEIEFNKTTRVFHLIKLANNDNKKIVERFLFRHLFHIIIEENSPDERQIAIG